MSLEEQYEHLVAVRNAELETYWTRYNIQVVLNGGLIIAAFASPSDSRLNNLPVWLVSSGGFILALVWIIMIILGKNWVHRWDKQISLFEQQLGEKDLYPLFSNIINSRAASNSWTNITAISVAVPVICAIAWIALWYYK